MPAMLGHNKSRMYVSTDVGVTWTPFSGSISGGNAAASATGAAVPASADYAGVNIGGTLRGVTGVNSSGTVYSPQVDIASVGGTTAAVNSGVKGNGTLRVVIATDQPALTNKLLVTADAVTIAAAQTLATVTTVSTVTSITNQVDTNLKQVGGTNTVSGGVNGSLAVGGPTASAGAIAANPLTIGARAATAPPTAVANAQVVNAQTNIYGELIVRHALRETKGNQATSISSSTAETTIVTADATYKLDLYGLILTNTSATATKVTIKDSTAGTTRMTFQVPAGEIRGFMLPASDGHKQAAANNNWTATCGTSIATLEITALFVQNL